MKSISNIKGWLTSFLFSTSGSLHTKIFRGGTWLSLGTVFTNGLGFLKIIVLARLLSPTDFGMMGVALVCLRWVEAFTESGFRAALIYHKGDILPYMDIVRIVQVVRSFVLVTFLLLFSDLIAKVIFDSSEASIVIKSISIIILLRGLQNPAIILFKKKLDMKVEFYIKLFSSISGFVVGVSTALYFKNVWALMLAFIASEIVVTALTYVYYPLMPRLEFSYAQARELFHYGKSVFLTNIFNFFKENFDSFLIAKFCGVQSLGYYQVVRQFCYDPAYQIASIIHGTLFPAFSTLNSRTRQKKLLIQSFGWIGKIILPVACIVSIYSPEIIYFSIGPNWQSLSGSLSVFIFASILLILNSVLTSCLAGTGRPDLPALAYVANFLGLFFFFIPSFFSLQEFGMVISVTLATGVAFIYLCFLCLKHIRLNIYTFIKEHRDDD